MADSLRIAIGSDDAGLRYKDVLVRVAKERYDWTSVARKLAREMNALAAEPVATG